MPASSLAGGTDYTLSFGIGGFLFFRDALLVISLGKFLHRKLVLPQFMAAGVEEVVAANPGITLQHQIASSDLVDPYVQKRLVLQWKAVVGPVCPMVRIIAAARNTADNARHCVAHRAKIRPPGKLHP